MKYKKRTSLSFLLRDVLFCDYLRTNVLDYLTSYHLFMQEKQMIDITVMLYTTLLN